MQGQMKQIQSQSVQPERYRERSRQADRGDRGKGKGGKVDRPNYDRDGSKDGGKGGKRQY